MSKIRQILQLHHQGRSKLAIAEQCGISRNTLKKYLKQFTESKLTFEQISELSDKYLEELFVKTQETDHLLMPHHDNIRGENYYQ